MLKINDANDFRRSAAGLCLIGGPLVTVIGGLIAPWEETEEVAAWLRVLAESPVRGQAGAILFHFGYLLIAVGIFGILHLLRRRAVVLGNIAGALAVWGWVSLPGLLVTDFYDLALAQSLGPREGAQISERAGESVGGAVLGIPVMLGMVGLVLLGFALWRAKLAPVWVPIALLVGFAMEFVAPQSVPPQVSFTVWFVLWLAALGYVGLKILGMSNEEWEHGASPADEAVVVEARAQVR